MLRLTQKWVTRSPVQLEAKEAGARQQGWFAVHDAAQPHWKQFWFD